MLSDSETEQELNACLDLCCEFIEACVRCIQSKPDCTLEDVDQNDCASLSLLCASWRACRSIPEHGETLFDAANQMASCILDDDKERAFGYCVPEKFKPQSALETLHQIDLASLATLSAMSSR